MPTIHVQAGSSARLQEIADSLWKAKKVVVVTGAGISTNSGIPDFRSENGLYSMIQSQFDAAARLDGSKNRANGVSSDDSGDETRPKKRRKTSLVGDSIEVGVPKLDRDSTVEGDSIKVLGPDDSQMSDLSEGGNPGDPAHKDDARPSNGADPEHERRDPAEEEVDLLTEESVLAGESTFLEPDAQGNSQHESDESASEAENSPPSTRPFKYSQTFKRASLSTMKGRDLFDASIWSDPVKTSVFYTFATNLRQKSREAYPTGSHHFISHLRDSGRMVRCYTQNIDLLEDKVGLSTRLLLGPGSRSRFSVKASRAAAAAALATAAAAATSAAPTVSLPSDSTDRPEPVAEISLPTDGRHEEEEKDSANDTAQPIATDGAKDQCRQGGTQTAPSSPEPDRGVECVYLHGSLRSLRCFQCRGVIDWDEGDRELQTMSGHQPPCPRCEDATTARQEKGKRALGVGKLRPDIVLYGEEHPESQRISDIIQHDLSLAPDLLIIMGTSLKVHGLKTVVKEFAKAIHNKKDGKVIFVNYTKPADSVWADTIDFWVEMDCDAWVHDLKEKKPIIWSPPGTIDEESRNTKRRRRTNVESEKAAVKKDNKGEGADEPPVGEPKSTAKKVEKKCSQAATKPCAVPKPAPKRPVSEREHKDNGAYWTTRIMSNLAFISGREVKRYSTVSTTPAPAKKPLGAGQAVSKPAEPVAPKQPLRKGRGPRLKNARTRKPVPAIATPENDAVSSHAVQDLASRQTGQAEDQKPSAGASSTERPDHQKRVTTSGELPASVTMEPKADPDVNIADKLSSHGSRDGTSPTAQVGQEASLVDSRGSPDTMVESNSILAAVKSHHRIRKPKAIFEPESMSLSKSGRGTPASSAGNAKSRAKPASQARKGRGSGKVVKTEPAAATRVEKSAILPPPIPVHRPVSQSSTSKPTESRRHGTPDEAYRLAPLHPENLESYKFQSQHSDRPYPLAKPLEPIVVVEGPPSDMSPTSPQHWQNRAFLLRDPQSRNFEGPCRGLDFVGMTPATQLDGQAATTGAPSAPPPPSQLATQLAMITAPPSYSSSAFASAPVMLPQNPGTMDSQLPPNAQSIHDSPSRQLHQEEALEAAAALHQLRSPPIFDERRFRI
ncbi:NAD-dependent deacetylase hst3 [Diaporthe eres]